jgi:hypothetical protein
MSKQAAAAGASPNMFAIPGEPEMVITKLEASTALSEETLAMRCEIVFGGKKFLVRNDGRGGANIVHLLTIEGARRGVHPIDTLHAFAKRLYPEEGYEALEALVNKAVAALQTLKLFGRRLSTTLVVLPSGKTIDDGAYRLRVPDTFANRTQALRDYPDGRILNDVIAEAVAAHEAAVALARKVQVPKPKLRRNGMSR